MGEVNYQNLGIIYFYTSIKLSLKAEFFQKITGARRRIKYCGAHKLNFDVILLIVASFNGFTQHRRLKVRCSYRLT